MRKAIAQREVEKIILCFWAMSGYALSGPQSAASPAPTLTQLSQSIFLILRIPDDPGSQPASSATGFFVTREGIAVTNHHVVEGAETEGLKLTALLGSGSNPESEDIEVLGSDADLDIAILRVGKLGAKPKVPLKFASTSGLKELDTIWICGFPGGPNMAVNVTVGPEPAIAKGEIAALRKDDAGSIKQVDVTASATFGSSGSSIVNADGHVVAVLWGTKDRMGQFVSGVASERVLEVLRPYANVALEVDAYPTHASD